MKIYLDILFAINLAFDFLICCIVGKILHFECRFFRILLAGTIGALGALVKVFTGSGIVFVLVFVLLPAAMLYVSFGRMNFKTFVKAYILLWGSSFVSGGLVFAAGELISRGLSEKWLFSLCLLSFFFCFYCCDFFACSSKLGAVKLSFVHDGKPETLRLLCDSGCLVREPIGGKPVILVSAKRFDGIYSGIDIPENALRLKKRLVPVKTVSGSSIIPAVLPEKLEYTYNGKTFACDAMLGRSENDSFAGFDGIFPETLL